MPRRRRNNAAPALAVSAALLTAAALTAPFAARTALAAGPTRPKLGVELTGMDRSVVPPTADFYRYANGIWLEKTPLPADKPRIDTFERLQERNQEVLRRLAEKAAKDAGSGPATTPAQKVGLYYKVALDEKKADALGARPLEPELARVAAVKDAGSLVDEIAHLHRIGVGVGFGFGAGQDFKDATQVIAQLGQGGIGLPDRDYYLNEDDRSKALRAAYVKAVTEMLTLSGDSPADAAKGAADVLAIETRLAKVSLTRVQRRDPNASYHKMDLAGLKAAAPGFDWDRYFKGVGKADPGPINLAHPDFFKEFAAMASAGDNAVPLDQWKTYLRFHLTRTAAPFLSKPFVDAGFRFSAALTGQSQISPRWKRALGATDGDLGEALGQLYVAETFPPEAKQRALDLVTNLKAVLRERIAGLDWMGEATKTQALKKLDAVAIKIGYPDKWRDYSGYAVKDDSYLANHLRSNEFDFEYQIGKVGKPLDRTEWGMTPPTVNAYYNPLLNEIVFPAGILQPPFFDPDADDAANYGAIGVVIGHEMTHGFDDTGRQFDAEGNLKDWWTPEDAKRFAERAQALVKQYGEYTAVGDVKVNGQLTQGENIADLGGITVAYLAFQKARAAHPERTPAELGGFTPDQRFFLAFAQIWREKNTPEFARLLVNVDTHSPGRWRTNGTLTNVPPFWAAFAPSPGKPGDKPATGATAPSAAPAQPVVIW
jgi:putative endopeptidase